MPRSTAPLALSGSVPSVALADCPLCGVEDAVSGPLQVPSNGSRALILAAGRGSRMQAATADRPKALLRIGSRSLLGYQLASLRAVGVGDVTIVAGYRAEQIRRAVGARAHVALNAEWARTNSLYSLWVARRWLLETPERGSVFILNSDVLASPTVLARLLHRGESAFAYDARSGHDAEHMKVDLRHGFLRAMSKDLPASQVAGENVGILRLDAVAIRVLVRTAEAVLARGAHQSWLAEAVERTAHHVALRAIDVSDLPWIEVDFPEDLVRAREEVWPQIRPAPEPRSLPVPPARYGPEAAPAL